MAGVGAMAVPAARAAIANAAAVLRIDRANISIPFFAGADCAGKYPEGQGLPNVARVSGPAGNIFRMLNSQRGEPITRGNAFPAPPPGAPLNDLARCGALEEDEHAGGGSQLPLLAMPSNLAPLASGTKGDAYAEGLILEFAGSTLATYRAVSEKLGMDTTNPKADWPAGLRFHAAGSTGAGYSCSRSGTHVTRRTGLCKPGLGPRCRPAARPSLRAWNGLRWRHIRYRPHSCTSVSAW